MSSAPSPSRPAVEWRDRPQGLRYKFGEFHLKTKYFRAAAVVSPVTSLPDDPNLEALPWERLSNELDVLVAGSHPVSERLPKLRSLPQALRYVPDHFSHYYVEIPGAFPEYLKNLSAKSRHELLRKQRKFIQLAGGETYPKTYRGNEVVEVFYPAARKISQLTYQERLLDVGLPQGDKFVEEMKQLAAEDRARGYLLFVHGEPIAYGYCQADGEVLNFMYTGYDPQYREWSPGQVLMYFMLESICNRETFRMFDFGYGDAQYKRMLATGSRQCAKIMYFRKSARNYALVGTHAALQATSDGLVRLMKRLGVKEQIKKFLRRSA